MTEQDTLQLKRILTEHGYHTTKARTDTFRLLMSPQPQSMAQLLAKATGSIDRVTVYRNIDLFEKLGIVHRIYIGWKYKLELSDDFTAHHHHLSCLGCGLTIDIEDEEHIEEFIQDITTKLGFQPRRHQFEVDGYCRNCLHGRTRLPQ